MSNETYAITSTLPIEIIYAAGDAVADVNNLFINSENPQAYLQIAERAGFPANSCAWVKGIFGFCTKNNWRQIIGVNEGDCSQNSTLLDILEHRGLTVLRFSFPAERTYAALNASIIALEKKFGVTRAQTEIVKKRFDELRAIAKNIDERAWQQRNVNSADLFTAQLLLTDMLSDVDAGEKRLRSLATKIDERGNNKIPLAVIGVPTIMGDLWATIENAGGRVIYHEVPHQFSLTENIGRDLVDSYLNYTYPAKAQIRLAEIKRQIELRQVRGIIHYAQAFCHRQMHDLLLREICSVPILTIEADRPTKIDGRTLTRIEAFLESLATR